MAVTLTLILAAPLALAAPNTHGVDQDGAHGLPGTQVLEEVIVTAQRREQSLIDVPVAVTALDGATLDRIGALDLSDLDRVVPNTSIEMARGTNNSIAAYIRGVGQQDHIAGFENGVGLYVDDVLYSRPQLALLDLFDVERIEVLRGPQGTLYGRNTVGGAIKYVTRGLAETPVVGLRGRFGSYGMRDLILGASLPVQDSLRLGATLASFNLDGFGDNLFLAGEQNYNKDVQAARASAEWRPAEAWFIRLAADRVEDDSNLRRGHRTRVGGQSGAPVLEDVFDSRAGNSNPAAEAESTGVSLLSEWRAAAGLTVRAILASRADVTWKPVDLDGLPMVDVDVSTWDHNRQKTAELQAVFNGDRVSGVAGLFALDASADTVLGVVLGTTGEIIGRPGLGNELRSFIDTHNWAAYTDLTVDLAERWSVSFGMRYTHDERIALIQRRVLAGGMSSFFGGSGVTVATTSDFRGSEVFEKITPRVSLQWRPAERQRLYLNYSEGFKGGGFDPRGLTSLAPDFDADGVVSGAEIHAFMKFEPEEVHSWEAGWKSVLFNGRASARLALFSADYINVQIPGSVAVDDNGDGVADTWVGITTNAASAPIHGFEWEAEGLLGQDLARPGDRLDLSCAIGRVDARFARWVDERGIDVAGERVFANTPEWTAAATASYGVPVSWFHREVWLSVTSTLSWRDDHSQFEQPIAEFDQPAYALWDISLMWSQTDGPWRGGFHGRNLGDKLYRVAGLNIDLGLEDNYTVYFGNPRQYWLDLQYRFN